MRPVWIAGIAALTALLWASAAYLRLDLGGLFAAGTLASFGRYIGEFFPPDLSPVYLAQVWSGALETLAISSLATLLASFAAIAIALPAAGRYGTAPRYAARLLLNALRSVPELVFAALMVLAAGLGPFAGTMALALHTSGVLGRLYAEALENAPRAPTQALRHAGSPRIAAFFYGTLPNVMPQFLAYGLYRWEINIRMAAVLGFVGAGGLGQMLHLSLSLFHQAQAASVILAMLALVLLVDQASAVLRRRMVVAAR